MTSEASVKGLAKEERSDDVRSETTRNQKEKLREVLPKCDESMRQSQGAKRRERERVSDRVSEARESG